MKSATGLTGSGSRDWFIQRVSAVVLAAYTVVLFGWILCKGGFDYQQWAGFMMTLPMKIFFFIGNFIAYRTRMDWYVAGFH